MELAFLAEVAGMTLGMSIDPINWGLAFLVFYLINVRWSFNFLLALTGIFSVMFLMRYGLLIIDPLNLSYSPFLYVAQRSHGIFGFSLFSSSIFYLFVMRRKSRDAMEKTST